MRVVLRVNLSVKTYLLKPPDDFFWKICFILYYKHVRIVHWIILRDTTLGFFWYSSIYPNRLKTVSFGPKIIHSFPFQGLFNLKDVFWTFKGICICSSKFLEEFLKDTMVCQEMQFLLLLLGLMLHEDCDVVCGRSELREFCLARVY